MKKIVCFYFLFFCVISYSQNRTEIKVELDTTKNELQIDQRITFYNASKDSLSAIYLHNWSNAYKNKKTELARRLLEDYDKSLYFAKKKDRGFSKILSVSNTNSSKKIAFENVDDIVKLELNEPLLPGDSLTIDTQFVVKIPSDKFTRYGANKNGYNLKYWYLLPAVYNSGWNTMHNLNMDDLFVNPMDYDITFKVPKNYILESDLEYAPILSDTTHSSYQLKGNNRTDVEIFISQQSAFTSYNAEKMSVISDIDGSKVKLENASTIVKRQIAFIESYLGKYPHEKLLVNKATYDKNPVYGLNQLPKILNPFNDTFEFDIKLFKALTNKYISNTIITNKRQDYWLNDGIQTYLMIKYIELYYPEIKSIGKIATIWGIRNYQLAKLDFNDKYTFVHQFATRKNLDQSLNTRADSLSTFNRKIVNKYKAGLGLQYLDNYLEDDVVKHSLQEFYKENNLSVAHSATFEGIVLSKTNKDVNWFFEDYLTSKKKLDYTIKRITKKKDSIDVTIKNLRNFTAPILLYGLKDKEIKFKKWLTDIDSTQTITLAKGDYNRLSLNSENIYPELNVRNNWKNLNPGLFNRPLQFRFLTDVENPYYNQVFYNIEYGYNFYDGIILGTSITNKTVFKKQWLYKFTPNYGFKSNTIVGSFSTIYQLYPETFPIYRLRAGVVGSNFHYAPDLAFNRLSPFVSVDFHRNSLRDVGFKTLFSRYVYIDRETNPGEARLESDNYGIFNVRYTYSKPEIIDDLRYNFDFQLTDNFSKFGIDFRYRKLTDKNRQFDFRLFAGIFLFNKTESDFFNFSLNRPTDYLFDYDYLGRSEDSGFLSQQFITNEGGFKSFFDNNMANQWMFTTNNSFSIWRWIEIYGDVGFFKNKGTKPIFKYDSGIRFNFVHNILEVYFPLQSSNGFEPSQLDYSSKIRFVLTLNPGRIFNFIKRGFY